jgi:hypothetical protein
MFYLPAIDKWMEQRSGLTTAETTSDASEVFKDRLRRAPWAT